MHELTEQEKEELLNFDYENLKYYLLSVDFNIKKQVLSDIRIKDKLINCEKRHDFIWLAQEQNQDIMPLLLDEQGAEILKNTTDLIDKLNGILTSGNAYVNELLSNEAFSDLIISNIQGLYTYLYVIDYQGAKYLLDKVENTNVSVFCNLITNFNEEVQKEVYRNYYIPSSKFWELVVSSASNASQILVDRFLVGKSLTDLNLKQFKFLIQKGIHFPKELFLEEDFVNKISSIYDAKEVRFILNGFSTSNDIEKIEKRREKFYDKEIHDYNISHGMLNRYHNLYAELCSLIDKDDMSNTREIINKHFNFFDDSRYAFNFQDNIFQFVVQKNKDDLHKFLKEESNFQITNMIIDYHFKDIYRNVLIDIKQLLNFQKTDGKILSEEQISIYEKILNLDKLPYLEKIRLFEQLKQNNWVEQFYDDIRLSKNKSFEMIKEQMLTKEKAQSILDKELSEKYGLPIYVLDGEPFCALVKALQKTKTYPITKIDVIGRSDGSSYSLDGSSKLRTFFDPRECYHLIYNDFEIGQVVHTYPVDSFTNYSRSSKVKPTSRIFEILTPEQLLTKSESYNEILLAQANILKPTDTDWRIPQPKPFAVYCYDEFTENDIESAKNLGVGIVLVKTKSYNIENRFQAEVTLWETMATGTSEDLEYNYIQYVDEDAMYGRRK